jgi:hypothetical protein
LPPRHTLIKKQGEREKKYGASTSASVPHLKPLPDVHYPMAGPIVVIMASFQYEANGPGATGILIYGNL